MRNANLILIILLVCSSGIAAQELFGPANDSVSLKKAPGYRMKANTKEVEINFLSSYYEQDGNNSAVTGGLGTEALYDFANVISLNVPLDSINSISFYGGVDAYTSASSDNIDSNVSSASMKDVRGYGTIGFNRKNLRRSEIYGIRAGFSKEYDYTSFSTGLSYTKEWNEGNTELNFNAQVFLDRWKIIYPEMWISEIWSKGALDNDRRNSYNAQIFLSQVINTRMIIGLSAEVIYMNGLLSTPFHSVFFKDGDYPWLPDIERLPTNRLKIPLAIRFNYFPLDFLILRSYYRFYWDDFGIKAHTFNIETPLKINKDFTVSPFYRFHIQTASTFFAPKAEHSVTQDYYTSDYDLAALYSHKAGLGLKYFPTYGLLRSKPLLNYLNIKDIFGYKALFMLKYIELRSALYSRSTDFNAWVISLNLGISIQ
jgi:hypothetical protein